MPRPWSSPVCDRGARWTFIGSWVSTQLGMTGAAGSTWLDGWYLDEPIISKDGSGEELTELHVVCRRNGVWLIPQAKLLEHWERARSARPTTVMLGARWKIPDL